MNWPDTLARWKRDFELRLGRPAPAAQVEAVDHELGPLPALLKSLYECANGLSAQWFRVLPVEDPQDIKRTWDGLRRANDPNTTKFRAGNSETLKRFVIFAEISGGACALIDRTDGTIWYEEEYALHQTVLSVPEFIETALREVRDL